MAETILIVGAGHFQVPLIQTAKQMGLKVITIDQDINAKGSEIADVFKPINIIDHQEAIEFAKKYDISGVTTVQSDIAVYPVSVIAEALGLPGIPTQVAKTATNKDLMRLKWKENNISSPNFKIVTTYQELKQAAIDIGLPVIIKPTDNAASRGVTRVDDLNKIHDAYEFAYNNSNVKRFLVEEYMDGSEHSVEAITYKGKTHILSISDKVRTKPPCMTDTSIDFPTSLPTELKNQIQNVVVQGIDTLGINLGPTHTEVMMTEKGPKLIEVGARGGGGDIATYVIPHVTGVDMGREIINLSLGFEPDLTHRINKGALVRFLVSKPGKVKKILGVNEAKKMAGIKRLTLFVKPGDVIREMRDGTDRTGYFVALNETKNEAIALADKTQDMIQFVLE